MAKSKVVLKKSKPAIKEEQKKIEQKKMIDNAIVDGIMNDSISELLSNKMKYCCHCGEVLDINEFNTTRSSIYKDGRIHICKKCIGDIIDKNIEIYGNIRDVLMIICSITNTIVIKEPFEDTIKQYSKPKAKKIDMYNHYVLLLDKYVIENSTWSKTNINFECSNFFSKPFNNCCMDDSLSKISELNVEEQLISSEEDDDDIELNPQQRRHLIRKWGEKEDKDLIWLDSREKSYYETHDIPNDHINKSGVITLCNLELQEFNMLCNGEDVKKILDGKSKVLSQMSFAPKKKTKDDLASNAIDLGSLIKKREEFSPIINSDPELDDIDNIGNISKALAGALCRTAKIESPMIGEFEKIMKDYTFEFSNDGADDD